MQSTKSKPGQFYWNTFLDQTNSKERERENVGNKRNLKMSNNCTMWTLFRPWFKNKI